MNGVTVYYTIENHRHLCRHRTSCALTDLDSIAAECAERHFWESAGDMKEADYPVTVHIYESQTGPQIGSRRVAIDCSPTFYVSHRDTT